MVGVGTSKERVGTALTVRYASSGFCGACETALSRLLEIWRGHWGIENRLHWVRDVNTHRLWYGSAPQLMAALRNLVIGMLRLSGVKNISAALRQYGGNPGRPFTHRTTPQQFKDPEDP